jgi:hypothetical protein
VASVASLVVLAAVSGCGGSSSSSISSHTSSSGTSARVVSLQALEACLNMAFHSENVESDVQPVNPASLEELYAAGRQRDFAVTLSNGGTAYVFVLPSASEATSAANASALSGHLLVRDNTVTAYVHSPPPSSAPPAQQKASLPLIAAPGRDGALIARCT